MSYVCRKGKVKGTDCICFALNFLNGVLGLSGDKTTIRHMALSIDNKVDLSGFKTRQRFLSPESEEDHFKVN